MYAPDKSLLYGYRDNYWMPGYSHHSWNGRLDYQHKTRRKGEHLTLSYMLALTRQHTEQESSYTDIQNAPFNYTGMLKSLRERFTEHTFQADWLRPVAEGHKLEMGVKYIYRGNTSHTVQDFYAATPYPSWRRVSNTSIVEIPAIRFRTSMLLRPIRRTAVSLSIPLRWQQPMPTTLCR